MASALHHTMVCTVALRAIVSAAVAQTPAPADATAEELAQRGLAAFAAGDYEAADAALTQFVEGFGNNPQVKEVLPRIYPPLALSRVHLKKFGPALEAITTVLAQHAKSTPADTVEELRFWNGVCEAQEKHLPEAHATLSAFARDYPRSRKRGEAILLAASLLVAQEQFKEAAAYLAQERSRLAAGDRGRAIVIELLALIRSGDSDSALRLVAAESPRASDIPQLVAFHTLILELGSTCLEAGEHRKAIACLQRVWTRDRLLKHQRQRLAVMRQYLKRATHTRATHYTIMQRRLMIAQIERELKALEQMEQFDSALRFRLAGAFLGLGRSREAALIMEDMLQEMPADAVVEQAALNLVRCWTEIDRWPRAIRAAEAFEEKFPQSEHLPLILLMKGQAQQSDYQYSEAVNTFADLLKRFPKHELAPRALFHKGFVLLLQEDYPAAVATLELLPKKHPQSDLVDPARYWRGMALSMAREFDAARIAFEEYLRGFPDGRMAPDAAYRRAYCIHAMKDYETGVGELRLFLDQHPETTYRGEALLLLGDALMALGKIDEGIAALMQIPPAETKFFEEGWFKIGKALRLQEKPVELREHMEHFVAEHPKSHRLVEALYWIGWVHRQEGAPEKAIEVYWGAIERFGDDPEHRAVDDLFPALAKLYKGDQERISLRTRLRDLREESDREERKTLAMRALWALSQLYAGKDPAHAQRLLVDAATRLDVRTANPLLIADIADACRESGRIKEAEQLYRDLLKWNPRAPRKDRAFAGLGLIAQATNREKAALEYFERFEMETPGSPLFGEVMLAKASLHATRDQFAEAQAALEALLAEKAARGHEKAEALYRIGELHMRQKQPGLAVPYFQRIYIMYARWSEFVAKAYLGSGEAFEQLGDSGAATRTYQEMLEIKELAQFEETTQAKARLAKLERAQ